MRWDKKSAAKVTSVALLSFTLASCNDDDLKNWLASTPIYPPMACPMALPLGSITISGTPETPPVPNTPVHSVPYFKFPPNAQRAINEGKLLSCIEDGPYSWNDTQWYVQRIEFIDDKDVKRFAARVCSLDAVPDKYGPARDLVVQTPGGPVQYVSPTKCQLIESH